MASPPMLRDRDGHRAAPPERPDPLAWLTAALLVVAAILLVVDGIGAVYTTATPGAEGPLVAVTAGVFLVALLVAVGGATVRKVRAGLP